MPADIILPDLGTRVRLTAWFADPGEYVYEGDRLVEVCLNEATFDIAAPASGKLADQRALPDDWLEPGQILGSVLLGDEHGGSGERP